MKLIRFDTLRTNHQRTINRLRNKYSMFLRGGSETYLDQLKWFASDSAKNYKAVYADDVFIGAVGFVPTKDKHTVEFSCITIGYLAFPSDVLFEFEEKAKDIGYKYVICEVYHIDEIKTELFRDSDYDVMYSNQKGTTFQKKI